MDKPIVKQDSSTSLKEPNGASGDFWDTFHLFPSRFDEFGFRHWYLYIIGSCLLFVLPSILYVIFGGIFGPGYQFFLKNNGLLLAFEATITVTVLSYNFWRHRIPTLFQTLLSKRRIVTKNQRGDIQQEYRLFLEHYQQKLWRNNRYWLAGFAMAVSLILFLVPEIPYISSPLLSIQWLIAFLVILLPALSLGYFLGTSAWTLITTGLTIRDLTAKFELVLEPSHPDNCGGLKFLGDFCLLMALPILAGVAFFGIYGIGSAFVPTLLHGQKTIQVIALAGLILFDVPLAAVAFFLPLGHIHGCMVELKEAYEDEFADRVSKLLKRIQDDLDQGAVDDAKAAKDEMDVVQVLNPATIGYPTWPFNRRTLVLYLLPQLLPFLGLVLQVIPLIPH